MSHKCFSRVALLAIALLALAGISVGKSAESARNDCPSTCNLRQGYCQPDGTCKCFSGWEGPNCDQCTIAPGCVHGSCDQPWQCTCNEGYGGRHCELDMQYCERHQPCRNGATCVNDAKGSYVCVCPEGFTGTTCASISQPDVTTTTMATPNLHCMNGGTCVLGNSIVGCEKCSCPKGFGGRQCEIQILMCVTRPCANGGRCHDLIGDFRCECARGYVGRYCNEDVNECAILGANACANGGRCVNTRGSYQCICPTGFEGSRCDKKIQRFTTPKPTTTTLAQTTSTTKAHRSPLETLFKGTDKSESKVEVPEIVPLVKQVVPRIEKKSSTNIKVTHIVRKVEVESSNSDVAFVEQVMDGSNMIMSNQSPPANQASVSVVQAVTFAFLGVAVALFIGIGAFMYIHCSKRGRRFSIACMGDSTDGEVAAAETEQRNNRNSLVVTSEAKVTEKRSIVRKGAVQSSACQPKPGLAVRTVTPPRGSRNVTEKVSHADCLYVALPQEGQRGEMTAMNEMNSLLDVSKLSQSSNYTRRH